MLDLLFSMKICICFISPETEKNEILFKNISLSLFLDINYVFLCSHTRDLYSKGLFILSSFPHCKSCYIYSFHYLDQSKVSAVFFKENYCLGVSKHKQQPHTDTLFFLQGDIPPYSLWNVKTRAVGKTSLFPEQF